MGFFDFLNSAFGGLSSLLANIVNFVIAFLNAILRVLAVIWNGVLTVLKYAVKGLQSIGTFFKHLWDGFFKNIFTGIMRALSKLHQFLEAHLRPIINFIKKVRAIVDRIYKLYIKPYLQFLQRIRRWLAVLKLLHIKFAETLDRRLAQTEAAIAHEFLLVRGVLNDVLNFVNSVADPRRLSRMVLVSIAGRRAAGAIVRAITGLPLGFFFPHTGKGALAFEKPVTSHAQLVDPASNPPVSAILSGLLPLPIDGFTESDPTPDDSELDALEISPFFGAIADDLLSGEIVLAALADSDTSIASYLKGTNPWFDEIGKSGVVTITALLEA